jgi:hypothetical protein
MQALVLGTLLMCGCSVNALNTTALSVSTAALACDWSQTRGFAAAGWDGFVESNPVMGSRPEASTVDLYFAAAAVLQIAAWWALPRKARWALPVAVIAFQAQAIANNAPYVAKSAAHRGSLGGYACGL